MDKEDTSETSSKADQGTHNVDEEVGLSLEEDTRRLAEELGITSDKAETHSFGCVDAHAGEDSCVRHLVGRRGMICWIQCTTIIVQ